MLAELKIDETPRSANYHFAHSKRKHIDSLLVAVSQSRNTQYDFVEVTWIRNRIR